MVKVSCFGQTDKSVNLKLTIYPSSGGEIGYVIEIKDKLLKVISKELTSENGSIILGKTKEIKERKLSNYQNSKIKRYLFELEGLEKEYKDFDLVLDAWIFDFLINNKKSIKINSYILGDSLNLKKTKKLIKCLRRLSPIKIDLRDFS